MPCDFLDKTRPVTGAYGTCTCKTCEDFDKGCFKDTPFDCTSGLIQGKTLGPVQKKMYDGAMKNGVRVLIPVIVVDTQETCTGIKKEIENILDAYKATNNVFNVSVTEADVSGNAIFTNPIILAAEIMSGAAKDSAGGFGVGIDATELSRVIVAALKQMKAKEAEATGVSAEDKKEYQ